LRLCVCVAVLFPVFLAVGVTSSSLEMTPPAADSPSHPMPPGMSTLAQTNGPWSANVEMCFQPNRRGAQEVVCHFAGPSYGEANCTN